MSYRFNALTALPDGPIFAPPIGENDTPVGWANLAACLNEMYRRFAPQCASESQEPEEELLRTERVHRYRFPTPIVGGMGSRAGFFVLFWGVKNPSVTWRIDVRVNGTLATTVTLPTMGGGSPNNAGSVFISFDDAVELTEVTLSRNTLDLNGQGIPIVTLAHLRAVAIVPTWNAALPDGVYTRGVIKLPEDEAAVPNAAGSTWLLHYCEAMLNELYTRRVPSYHHSTRQQAVPEASPTQLRPVTICQPPTPPGVGQVIVDVYVDRTVTLTAVAGGVSYTVGRTGAGWLTITIDVKGDIYSPQEIRLDSGAAIVEAVSIYSARATLP